MKREIQVKFNPLLQSFCYCCLLLLTPGSLLALNGLNQYADALEFSTKNNAYHTTQIPITTHVRTILETSDSTVIPEEKYLVSEATVLSFNEPQVHYTYALIIKHYISHAHEYLQRPTGMPIYVTIQLYPDHTSVYHLRLLEELTKDALSQFIIVPAPTNFNASEQPYTLEFPEKNIHVSFIRDNVLSHTEKTDILLTFGFAKSLNNLLKPGSVVIPNTFIPMDIDSMTLYIGKNPQFSNHLSKVISELVKSQDTELLDTINQFYPSENPQKADHLAKKINIHTFKQAKLVSPNQTVPHNLLSKSFQVSQQSFKKDG